MSDNRHNYAIGYRRDEKRLELIGKAKPIDAKINSNLGRPVGFSHKQAAETLRDAIAANFISEGDAPELFPYLKRHKPQDSEWKVVEHGLDDSQLNQIVSAYIVELIPNHKLSFKKLGYLQSNFCLPANISGSLKAHLADGYAAYVKVADGDMVWMSAPAYHALQEWRGHEEEYQCQANDWKAIMERVARKDDFNKAVSQYEVFKKLDFNWCVTTHNFVPNVDGVVHNEKPSILPMDDNDKTLHIMILSADSKECRMLCMNDETPPSKIPPAQEYACYAGDMLIQTIPYKVTCPQCQLIAVNHICDKEEIK